MPRARTESNRKVSTRGKRSSTITKEVEETNDSNQSDDDLNEVSKSPSGSDVDSKTGMDEEVQYHPDFNGSMSILLEKFSTDLNKTMVAKKRKLEQYTQESTRSAYKKVLETNKSQSAERKMLIENFKNQMSAVIQQGEVELDKLKNNEDKFHKALLQQQKHNQQITISHSQRLKALRNLGEEFCKGMDLIESHHVEQYSNVHGELRKEMALLQKKILMDIQQQEMMNVRKHLKQIIP